MILSPNISNLNTPRVSISSVQSNKSCSDLSLCIRSSNSSLHSNNPSPLNFLKHSTDQTPVGTFGHSLSKYSDSMNISPPYTGKSSPPPSVNQTTISQQSQYHPHDSASRKSPPSYEETLALRNYGTCNKSNFEIK